MLLRQLIVVLFVMALGWLLRRLFGTAITRSDRRSGVPPPASDGEMVRDRVCNTFLPRGSALTSQIDGELHFFCSERCRQAFLERS